MILIDKNLSYRIGSLLKSAYKGIRHVSDVHLDTSSDEDIWEYASSKQLHILTKDRDFNDLLQMKGFPPKIIWLRLGNASTKQIVARLEQHQAQIKDFLDDEHIGLLEIR